MLMAEERNLVVHYGRKLLASGLTKGTGGNISLCDRAQGLMAISPSALDYADTHPEDVVVMDLAGRVVDGKRKPSTEASMHSIFYTDRQDVNAVVHAHSIAASTMAALHWALPAANYLVALSGNVAVPCAAYATFGTAELARNALAAMDRGHACFLANHGLLTAASDVRSAFTIAEEIEHCAEIYLRAKAVGEPVIIPEAEMARMFDLFRSYGKRAD